MIYLRTFQTAAEYSAATIVTPNVSLIKSDMSLRYNPYVSMLGDLKVTYDITATTEEILFNGGGAEVVAAVAVAVEVDLLQLKCGLMALKLHQQINIRLPQLETISLNINLLKGKLQYTVVHLNKYIL